MTLVSGNLLSGHFLWGGLAIFVLTYNSNSSEAEQCSSLYPSRGRGGSVQVGVQYWVKHLVQQAGTANSEIQDRNSYLLYLYLQFAAPMLCPAWRPTACLLPSPTGRQHNRFPDLPAGLVLILPAAGSPQTCTRHGAQQGGGGQGTSPRVLYSNSTAHLGDHIRTHKSTHKLTIL